MSDEKLEQSTEVSQQSEPSVAKPSPAADSKISLNMDEFQSIIKATVEGVLQNSKLDETRKQASDYNARMAESVKNSQATLIKPNITDGQKHTDYIERVLTEDDRRRKQSGEGKARYSDKGEDFIKAKIVLLHKMGLNKEEIAKELADIL